MDDPQEAGLGACDRLDGLARTRIAEERDEVARVPGAQRDAAQPNPNAMVLATVDAQGAPSARVVLCKEILVERGGVVFYTNYESRKGRELAATGRAAIVFHWDHRHRQVRIEGTVERVPEATSDAYFASRPWQSRLGAWASRQSQPIASLAAMREQVRAGDAGSIAHVPSLCSRHSHCVT